MSYLVLDLEMTGTEPGWHEIIQIGAVLYDNNWKELGRYLQNAYPENEESYSLPALEIHGLTLEDLEEAPMIEEVLESFEAWILEKLNIKPNPNAFDNSPYLKKTILCGQSVINDINFLRFAYRDLNRKWPFSFKLIDLHTLSFFVFKVLDKNGYQTPRSHSLASVADYFGFERASDIHNALEDSILTGLCFKEMMKIGQNLNLTVDLDDLLDGEG